MKKLRPGSHVWQRTDDNFCKCGKQSSQDYYFEQAGRGDDTLAIMEADRTVGAGEYVEEGGVKFLVEKVLISLDDLGFERSPIRIISPTAPPFGKWKQVDDEYPSGEIC
ncbi:hypothetical protein [Nocardia salmonicida]|uniref:hypothetical protein n=1 Tax=Nocardia salmonicida TaxID=53431 RepID=UPI00340B49BA